MEVVREAKAQDAPKEEPSKFPEIESELEVLRQQNKSLVNEINGMGCPPISFADQRYELMLDVLLGEEGETEERMRFDLAWEQRAHAILASVKEQWSSQAAKAKLMQGVPQMPPPGAPGGPQLIRPGG